MFKILVDGVEHGSYTSRTVCLTVGSAANADVRLEAAAAEHIKIYPLHGSYGGCFKVTVHARAGMTQHTTTWKGERQTVQWTTDPPNWLVAKDINFLGLEGKKTVRIHGERPGYVLVHGGDSMTVGDHEIQVLNWCGTCGREDKDLWKCTCAARAT